MRPLIASFKIFLFILLCFVTIPLQAINSLLLGKTHALYSIQTLFFSLLCLIFRVKVNLSGQKASGHVVYVGNHLSYIDIVAVGAHLDATFISKADVKNWPVLGLLATLSRTVFIERSRNAATKCIADIKATLSNGRSLILFPEGTSTNGLDVLPFKSTIFELFLNQKIKSNLIVQPFTITLKKVNGQNITNPKDQDSYAWYGDMTLPPHLWSLAKSKGAKVLITFHPPRPATDFQDRKEFALACHQDVAQGLKNTLPATLDFKAEAP